MSKKGILKFLSAGWEKFTRKFSNIFQKIFPQHLIIMNTNDNKINDFWLKNFFMRMQIFLNDKFIKVVEKYSSLAPNGGQ